MKKFLLMAIVVLGAFGCSDATQEEKPQTKNETTKPAQESPTVENFTLNVSL